MSIFKNLAKGVLGGDNIIKNIGDIVDNLHTSDEEKMQAKQALEHLLQHDRANAREMYKQDSALQKGFALVFLIGYMLLTTGMLYFIYTIAFNVGTDMGELPDWAVAFLSTLFGAMSAKVSTITDFLFGGSKK